jgi:hypothetical protein
LKGATVIESYDLHPGERILLSHISTWAQTRKEIPNTEARAIFHAIQCSFDGSSGHAIVVNSYLLHNLAACAVVTLDYFGKMEEIPLNKGAHDYILIRTLRGFTSTLAGAIKDRQCKLNNDGSATINAFRVPAELVTWAQSVNHTEATLMELTAHRNR